MEECSMTIQWFPGHMAKAKREVEEKLKLVDFVIELVDARAPLSSQNPLIHQVLNQKTKMMILMKRDLADPEMTEKWLQYFQSNEVPAVAIDVNNRKDLQKAVEMAKEIGNEKLERMRRKGVRPRPARAMIIGIPNVGKSTLINRMANKKIAKTGDRPGVTKQQQWIKIKKDFELMDTPGILWPKFEDQEVGYRLAAIGTIKDEILALDDIAAYVIHFLKEKYPNVLHERYKLDESSEEDMWEVFQQIGRQRGCLESGGKVNMTKTADVILQDLRSGKLGRITLEKPS